MPELAGGALRGGRGSGTAEPRSCCVPLQVDENGHLLGIISRGNIIRAALEHRKAMKANQ